MDRGGDFLKILDDRELMSIQGGGISIAGYLAITGGVVFLIGLIDGYMNPKACLVKN